MFEKLRNIFQVPELRRRILFTLGLFVIYRLGEHVPTPGVNAAALTAAFRSQANTLFGMYDMFVGQAFSKATIFALGIMPYISASIIVQLLATVSPRLEALKKEGEAGRKALNQYTRMGTVILAAVQAFGIAAGLQNSTGVVTNPGTFFLASSVITLTGGTLFLMWLGEQITARGVGNGISLIIFSGIVAAYPGAIYNTFEMGRNGSISIFGILLFFAIIAATIFFIVYMERAQRRLLVQYPKRQVGANRTTGGESSHLPLKLNTAGVIPPIFASSLLLLPITAAQLASSGTSGGPEWLTNLVAALGRGQPLHLVVYVALIIFFAFFYTAVVFNPKETAENLRKYGGFIPGIRPGEKTAEYIDYVLTRITVVGAIYIAIVCVMPELLISYAAVPFYFGGTSLLIIVVVTMDFMTQVQAYMMSQQYESLLKKANFKGGVPSR